MVLLWFFMTQAVEAKEGRIPIPNMKISILLQLHPKTYNQKFDRFEDIFSIIWRWLGYIEFLSV